MYRLVTTAPETMILPLKQDLEGRSEQIICPVNGNNVGDDEVDNQVDALLVLVGYEVLVVVRVNDENVALELVRVIRTIGRPVATKI